MAIKGQAFNKYSEVLKREAVRLCESGVSSPEVAKHTWVKGRPRTKIASVEEELSYVKAEKKRYPNLHKE